MQEAPVWGLYFDIRPTLYKLNSQMKETTLLIKRNRPSIESAGSPRYRLFATVVLLLPLVTFPVSGQLVWTANTNTQVSTVAFSPDGTQLASGSESDIIRLWSVTDGNDIGRLDAPELVPGTLAFSPDGVLIASIANLIQGAPPSFDAYVVLIDVISGEEKLRFLAHEDEIASIAFSPDGTQLATGAWDNTIKLWDVTTGTQINLFEGHIDWINSIAFSPDGTQLASASDDETARLWDVAGGELIKVFEGHTNWVTSVAFSPDGTQLATGSWDETARLWNVLTGNEVHKFQHTSIVFSVAFSPDGTQMASSGGTLGNRDSGNSDSGNLDFNIRLWDTATGNEIRRFEGHTDLVGSVAYSPNGRYLASASADSTIRLWEAASQVAAEQITELPTSIILDQNYPNPFNPATTIRFQLPNPAHVRLRVFDALGRHVSTLVDSPRTAGYHQVHFRAADLSSGTYFYQLRTGTTSITRWMQLVR